MNDNDQFKMYGKDELKRRKDTSEIVPTFYKVGNVVAVIGASVGKIIVFS